MEAHWASAAAPESIHLRQPRKEQEHSLSCIGIYMRKHIRVYIYGFTFFGFPFNLIELEPWLRFSLHRISVPWYKLYVFPSRSAAG